MRKTKAVNSLKEKWLNLWKTRDKLLNRMNFMVWGPSLVSTACLITAVFMTSQPSINNGLPLSYLYVGTAVPVALLVLRQILDFTYREELIMNSLADYILQAKKPREAVPSARKYEPAPEVKKKDPVLQEEMVERIAASIRQTAATGSHFSKMLSPEEEEIMREIIREFME